MRTRIIGAAGAAALLAGATSAGAGVLVTPPFPATIASSGLAGCQATNVGPKRAEVTVELIDNLGTVVESIGPKTLEPGTTALDLVEDIVPPTYPTRCRFTFKGKVKGSFFWQSGTSYVVVPAEK